MQGISGDQNKRERGLTEGQLLVPWELPIPIPCLSGDQHQEVGCLPSTVSHNLSFRIDPVLWHSANSLQIWASRQSLLLTKQVLGDILIWYFQYLSQYWYLHPFVWFLGYSHILFIKEELPLWNLSLYSTLGIGIEETNVGIGILASRISVRYWNKKKCRTASA